MGYRVVCDDGQGATFECLHEALKYGRKVRNCSVVDERGVVLAIVLHSDCDTATTRRRALEASNTNAAILGTQRKPIEHAPQKPRWRVDDGGCAHDWERSPYDHARFRCTTCGALGGRKPHPSAALRDGLEPIRPRRCSRDGCRTAARHYGEHVRSVYCDLHHAGAQGAA